MRITFISLMSGLPWGGSESYWSSKANDYLEQKHEVLISVYDWGKDTHKRIYELKEKGASVVFRERFSHDVSLKKKASRYLRNCIQNLNNTWEHITKFAPDHIYINQGGNFDILIHHYDLFQKLMKKNFSYSLICHSHVQFSFIPEQNIYPRGKNVFQSAKEVLFVSEKQKHLTERALLSKLGNARIFVNPLNLLNIKYLEWPENEIAQLAIVGAIVSGKGHDTLLEVLAQEQWKTRKWVLNIYGKGYGLEYLQGLAKYLNIEDNVCFCGHVESATEIWNKNHILLMPSSGEGLPISLTEAAICGRTAVVTDVGGNTEVIKNNTNGFVACAPTTVAFSEAMERAWKRKNEWESLGEKLSNEILNSRKFVI